MCFSNIPKEWMDKATKLKESSYSLPDDVLFDSRYANSYKFYSPSTKQFYTILDMEKEF